MKKIRLSLMTTMSIIILNGCMYNNSDSLIIEEENACGIIKPVLSFEQTIKKIASNEGFSARIKNHSNQNPSVFAKDFIDLKTEMENTNLDFEVYNYTDTMNTKRVSIFSKGDRYGIDKELMKIEYIATNTQFVTIGDVIKIFEKYQIVLDVPYHLQPKIITLTPDANYKLSDLLNEVTNKLLSMNIHNKVIAKYNPEIKKITVQVLLEELNYKYPEDVSKVLSEEFKKFNIPFKRTTESISILGNYKQQILAKDIIEKKLKNYANVYVGCLKKGNSFEGITIRDNIETPLDTFESIKITKVEENENGIEDYVVLHKTSSGVKEYKLKTNESKIKINKEDLNLKIKLY